MFLLRWSSNSTNVDFSYASSLAEGLGPDKRFVGKDWKNEKGQTFNQAAHAHGLAVHPWVLRNDELYFTDNAIKENQFYWEVDCDGIFTEFPETTWAVFSNASLKPSMKKEHSKKKGKN